MNERLKRFQDETEEVLVLATIARVARAEIRKVFQIDSCIASTRTVIDVLKQYGIKGIPLAVRTVASSKKGAVVLGQVEYPLRGAWRGSAAGHLIVVMPKSQMLIDASLDQVDGGAPGVRNFPCPFIAQAPEGFIAGRTRAIFSLGDRELSYEPSVIPKRILTKSDWNNDSLIRPIVERICHQIDSTRPLATGLMSGMPSHIQKY